MLAVKKGFDLKLSLHEQSLLYMPFMHSESLEVHDNYVIPKCTTFSKAEKIHYDIIKQFGRYPSRNGALGRESTEGEIEFLKAHDGF